MYSFVNQCHPNKFNKKGGKGFASKVWGKCIWLKETENLIVFLKQKRIYFSHLTRTESCWKWLSCLVIIHGFRTYFSSLSCRIFGSFPPDYRYASCTSRQDICFHVRVIDVQANGNNTPTCPFSLRKAKLLANHNQQVSV